MNFMAANILCHEPVGAMSYFTTGICEERTVHSALDLVQYNISFPLVNSTTQKKLHFYSSYIKQQGCLMMTIGTKGEHFLSL